MQRLFAVMLLISATCFAQTATKPSPENDIVQLTQRWLVAGHNADAGALDSIEADDFIATTPGGNVVSKAELMPDPADPSNRLPKLALQGTTVRVHGDVAVLMARLVSEAGGLQLDATNVFVRRDGRWQMIAAQLSPQLKRQ